MKTSKKFLIVLVLKILEAHTDSHHPITQSKILQYISDVFPCDRKTIGRNIKALQSVGYPIVKTSKGFYMNNKVFSMQEVDFVLQAIGQAQDVEQVNKTELCAKLQSCLGGFLKR
ncbi:MAG: hypothetical protein IJF10_05360 [Clostridia bacterium]|nr:hypothetical protein [Clostridia bacterium]